ncbi:YT521-B-like domain-containing protein [Cyathus striatus]|nr:YT521-B-like domain-containing protein [Cyathus striatus]
MHRDASEDMPDSPSMPDQPKPGSSSRRTTSRSQPHNRPPAPHSLQPPPASTTHSFAALSPAASTPFHYSSGALSYTQRPGYAGQYTVSSPQPPPLAIAHTPPPPFAFSTPTTRFHLLFQLEIVPHVSAPSSGAGVHLALVPTAPCGQSSAIRLRMLAPANSLPTIPQSCLAPVCIPPAVVRQFVAHVSLPPQHFASPDAESQGTWWYMPPQQQYDNGPPPYQGHYQLSYPSLQHPDSEGSYSASGPRSAASSADQHHTPSPPHSTGLGPPTHQQPDGAKRPPIRRHYHPNPPASRSEWVMWTGNVPSDATHDELWKFFTGQDNEAMGVVSIFLIARSNCAFQAIERFNGEPLRPNDPRCARLDDDLKAGVGEMKNRGRMSSERSDLSASDDPPTSPSSSSDHNMAAAMSSVSISSDEGRPRHVKHSSSSGSYASTNSSILSRHFPQRYFILKSLTQYDLDLSVETGLWATQKHNEGILDQAYRTSKDVYLIFSVNKSGEFYGYARMSGPVRRGERRVSWASRGSISPVPPARSIQPPLTGKDAEHATTITSLASETYFTPSPGRQVDSSPLPVDGSEPLYPAGGDGQRTPGSQGRLPASAPAELGKPHRKVTSGTPSEKYSLDHRTLRQVRLPDGFSLDPSAPARAAKQGSGSSGPDGVPGSISTLQSVVEEDEVPQVEGDHSLPDRGARGADKADETWGDCFQVQWLSTQRLSFYHTRHIRNPWNHDREVKVSRDGTELEPSVGRTLLEEWERLAEMQAPPPPVVPPGKAPANARRPRGVAASGSVGGASREGGGDGGGERRTSRS